ncbi:hypothetical protein G7Y89_g14272 [Cudoniella acicularis]|uniref:Uncharacterized protein n=1 Tax=Cudoniella acicularis TaxID=354080 RepID=A0A8H4VWC1_9HELO|nr:hypothetical protein G7Y89_g14272 [Cudoniella acicularis]
MLAFPDTAEDLAPAAPTASPAPFGPPPLPEEWASNWNAQYSTWFYHHAATGSRNGTFLLPSSLHPHNRVPPMDGRLE